MSAEKVAIEILQEITRKAFAITPGLAMFLLMRLHSLFAPLLQWYFDSFVKESHKTKKLRITNKTELPGNEINFYR